MYVIQKIHCLALHIIINKAIEIKLEYNETSINVKPENGAFCRCKQSKSKQRGARSTRTSGTATAARYTTRPLRHRNRRRTSPSRCRKSYVSPPATGISVFNCCVPSSLGGALVLESFHAHFYTLERCTRLRRGHCVLLISQNRNSIISFHQSLINKLWFAFYCSVNYVAPLVPLSQN